MRGAAHCGTLHNPHWGCVEAEPNKRSTLCTGTAKRGQGSTHGERLPSPYRAMVHRRLRRGGSSRGPWPHEALSGEARTPPEECADSGPQEVPKGRSSATVKGEESNINCHEQTRRRRARKHLAPEQSVCAPVRLGQAHPPDPNPPQTCVQPLASKKVGNAMSRCPPLSRNSPPTRPS